MADDEGDDDLEEFLDRLSWDDPHPWDYVA